MPFTSRRCARGRCQRRRPAGRRVDAVTPHVRRRPQRIVNWRRRATTPPTRSNASNWRLSDGSQCRERCNRRRRVVHQMDRGPPAAPEDRRTKGRALVEAACRSVGASRRGRTRSARPARRSRAAVRALAGMRPAPPDGAAVPPDLSCAARVRRRRHIPSTEVRGITWSSS